MHGRIVNRGIQLAIPNVYQLMMEQGDGGAVVHQISNQLTVDILANLLVLLALSLGKHLIQEKSAR